VSSHSKGRSALPPANLVLPFCQDAMVTRCFGKPGLCCYRQSDGNRKQGRKELHFTGKSQITGPDGAILCAPEGSRLKRR